MATQTSSPVFDYKALRLFVGIIALVLPFVVSIIAFTPLPTISAAYYTNARDVLVGMLFIVGSFMIAYNGHTLPEAIAAKVAGVAAILIALFPTACSGCDANLSSHIHDGSAIILFFILAYFCLGPFRKNTKGQKGKKGFRSKIYLLCGWVMVICIVGMAISRIVFTKEQLSSTEITYWGEAIALGAFGVAWIVAGKYIPFLVDKEDRLHLFRK